MTEFTDERLMALADGEMAQEEARRLLGIVSADPELQRRYEAFRQTGRALSRVFEPIEHAPVPARLIETVRTAPIGPARAPVRAAAAPGALDILVAQVRAFFTTPVGWAAVAATGALVAAVGSGLLGSDINRDALGGGDLAALNRAGSLAPAPVARVLEGGRSGQISQIALATGAAEIEPKLTFLSKDRQFCREYAVRAADAGSRGLACRDAAGWRIVAVSVASAPSGPRSGTRPAEGQSDAGINAAVDQRIVGDVLTADAETRLIANGWKDTME